MLLLNFMLGSTLTSFAPVYGGILIVYIFASLA